MMTKENITIAALRLFLLRGYKYVSLVDVANEVGMTKGGIYHYFASKEELLHASVHYLFDRCETKYTELFRATKSLRETLHAILVEQTLERYAQNLLCVEKGDYRVNYASFALEVMQNFPEIQERIDRSQLSLCNIIEQKIQTAMDKQEVRGDLNSHAMAVIILSILEGQHPLGSHFKTPEIRKQMMDHIWKLISV
jgi:AcrR family transcriptional regulator